MASHKTHYEDCDILVVGGGMAGTGATFEARHWGRDMKIVCVEKAFSTQTIFMSLPQCLASKVAPVPAIPPPTTNISQSS